jgi:hypothetical protein
MPDDNVDRALVAATAAKAANMTEFLTLLGLDRDRLTRRRWRARLKRWGISRDHWTYSPGRYYSDEALVEAVASSVTFAEVRRKLGAPLCGGSYAHLVRRIQRADIDTSHFLGQAQRRGQASPRRRDPAQVLVQLPAGSFRPKAPTLRRALVASGVIERCAECGQPPDWRGQPLRLIVDHISGDWLDNRLQNLRFLCPNCHSQTATWCRRPSARSTI